MTMTNARQETPKCLSAAELRDVILRAHGMTSGTYVQSDTEMLRRIGKLLDQTIDSDAVMRGFLGRGGPCAGNDILGGTGSLDDPTYRSIDS